MSTPADPRDRYTDPQCKWCSAAVTPDDLGVCPACTANLRSMSWQPPPDEPDVSDTSDTSDPRDALVASPHFEWRPGMRNTDGGLVYEGSDPDDGPPALVRWAARRGISDYMEVDDERPDLDDDATRGCLLALVRKAWGERGLCCICGTATGPSGTRVEWRVCVDMGNRFTAAVGPTEGLALAAALLAAPRRA